MEWPDPGPDPKKRSNFISHLQVSLKGNNNGHKLKMLKAKRQIYMYTILPKITINRQSEDIGSAIMTCNYTFTTFRLAHLLLSRQQFTSY